MELLQEHSLLQKVLEPTRGANALDLLLTNDTDLVNDIEVVDGIPGSDHDAIKVTIKLGRTPLPAPKWLSYNFKRPTSKCSTTSLVKSHGFAAS